MAKTRTRYVCSKCGWQGPRMMGRCPNCSEFGTIDPEVVEVRKEGKSKKNQRAPIGASRARPQKLAEVDLKEQERMYVPMGEFSRVLGGGLVPGSISLIGGEPGIGKCLTGDTRVFNPITGDYLPIQDLANGQHHVLSVNDTTYCFEPDDVIQFHERGKKNIIEVTTRLGNRLRCTPEHPVLTENGWQAIGSLDEGSRIASPRALPYFGNDTLPEAEIKLLAYILSDGSAQSQISITNMQPETADDAQEIAEYFNMLVRIYQKKNNRAKQYRFVNKGRKEARIEFSHAMKVVKDKLNISWMKWASLANVDYWVFRTYKDGNAVPPEEVLQQIADAVDVPIDELAPDARDKADKLTSIARYLSELGLRYSKALDKSVPDCVFRLPRQEMALFLKILFSCDGSVYVANKTMAGISYSTISRRLAEDVKHLLLRFGFVPRIRTKIQTVNKQAYTAYELQLLGTATVLQFLDEIGIYGREEAKAKIAELPIPERPSSQWDTIPTGQTFYEHVQQVAETSNFAEISRQIGTHFINRRHERPLTRYMVEKIADAYPQDGRLQALAYSDIYWDEIISIEEAGIEEVYDLTIDKQANFVANGLVVHNSTLTLQMAAMLAEEHGNVLYVSGEESARQIKMRADRLSIKSDDLYLLTETNLGNIFEEVNNIDPILLIIDSIQTTYTDELDSSPGLVSQVREVATRLQGLAKSNGVTTMIIGHVTKEGNIAGPRVLEHIVDTVLYLEGEQFQSFRLLRTIKNRFGATSEVGVFEMLGSGMVEVPNPSEAFLAERVVNSAGSAIAVTMEGTRPLLVEIQALTNPTAFGNPRRTSNGVDYNRLLLLSAVLSKRMGLRLFEHDIFVNVVGGLKITEPASDLATAVAIASSYYDVAVPADTVFIGEIGLSGEIRTVNQLSVRLNEASKIGFRKVVMPKMRRKLEDIPPELELIQVRNIGEALSRILPKDK